MHVACKRLGSVVHRPAAAEAARRGGVVRVPGVAARVRLQDRRSADAPETEA